MQSEYTEKTRAEKREYWEEQIRLWKESGLSQSEYCRQYDIPPSQWFYWKRRCQDVDADLTLVPLKLPALNRTHHIAPLVRVMTPNGFTIELDGDAPLRSLSQLIREVAAL